MAGAVWTIPATPALAASNVVITGGGWGHGLGLSQWGTYERARQGDSASQILRHYYTGTTVTETKLPSTVRVGLLQAQTEIAFSSKPAAPGGGQVTFSIQGSKPFVSGDSGTTWRVQPAAAGGVNLYKNNQPVSVNGDQSLGGKNPVVVSYEPYDTLLRVVDEDNYYRYGTMILETYAGSCGAGRCLRLMSEVPMEDYVLGIAEVSPYWPKEALRTQAIIARTYASHKITTTGQHRQPCDCAVYDSSYDQVYIGEDRRTDSGTYWRAWKRAVRSTAGTAVLYNGKPILSLYMSSSGGHTENNEDVWGGTPLPYLRGVPDSADATSANVNHTWRVEMSFSTFSSRLSSYFGTGTLQSFKLMNPFGSSGRVTVVKSATEGGVRIVGSARTVRASGSQVKSALGLKDTLFRVQIVD
jgi:stage II sporulation protein D